VDVCLGFSEVHQTLILAITKRGLSGVFLPFLSLIVAMDGDAWVMLPILFTIRAWQFVNETTETFDALFNQRNVTSNPQKKHFLGRTAQSGIGCRNHRRTLPIPRNIQ
jgi:hypothetical protein